MAIFSFSFTLFCGAFLLFIIQPMVAKAILPVYGGSTSVWTVCMLFFQLILWLAYGYSWLISRIQPAHKWRILHIIIFITSFSSIPLLIDHLNPGTIPELAILKTLTKQLFFPLLIVASTAPLIQYAFSQTNLKRSSDPYFLYAASNFGSLFALLSYPLLIERHSSLSAQFWCWNLVFVLYFFFVIVCFFLVPQKKITQREIIKPEEMSPQRIAYWMLLSFIPCSLMLGVTSYLTSDIAATPLLWIFPLALYLLSFIISFKSDTLIQPDTLGKYLVPIIFLTLLGYFSPPNFFKIWQLMIFNLFSFFTISLYCHTKLYQTRPSIFHLTNFYFYIASGGVLAGIFNGFFAPNLFSDAYEYPLVLISIFAIIKLKAKRYDWICPTMVLVILLVYYFTQKVLPYQFLETKYLISLLALLVILILKPNRFFLMLSLLLITIFFLTVQNNKNTILEKQRNFFGIKKIVQADDIHILFNHTTVHGFQIMSLKQQNGQQSYYGGLVNVINMFHHRYGPLKATIIGIGTGMMACQFTDKDKLTLIDIDPQVISIAKNNHYFTFIQNCAKNAKIILGDGRKKTSQLKKYSQDIIILDAFTSDAVPTHLLTLEAMEQYQKVLSNHGVILINITNRHINLLPVLTAISRQLNLILLHQQYPGNPAKFQFSSEWALFTDNQQFAQSLIRNSHWNFVYFSKQVLWRDDYSSLVSVLKA